MKITDLTEQKRCIQVIEEALSNAQEIEIEINSIDDNYLYEEKDVIEGYGFLGLSSRTLTRNVLKEDWIELLFNKLIKKFPVGTIKISIFDLDLIIFPSEFEKMFIYVKDNFSPYKTYFLFR